MIDILDFIGNKFSFILKIYFVISYIVSFGYFLYLLLFDTYNSAYYNFMNNLVLPIYNVFIFPVLHISKNSSDYCVGLNIWDSKDWSMALFNLFLLSLVYMIVYVSKVLIDALFDK